MDGPCERCTLLRIQILNRNPWRYHRFSDWHSFFTRYAGVRGTERVDKLANSVIMENWKKWLNRYHQSLGIMKKEQFIKSSRQIVNQQITSVISHYTLKKMLQKRTERSECSECNPKWPQKYSIYTLRRLYFQWSYVLIKKHLFKRHVSYDANIQSHHGASDCFPIIT